MARRQHDRPRTLEEAVAQLKVDPGHPVLVVVDGMEIEMRRAAEPDIVSGVADQSNLGDRIAALGPWEGESTAEIVSIIREGRDLRSRTIPDLL